MRKSFFFSLILLLCLAGFSSMAQNKTITGEGDIVSATRNNSGFSAIDLRIPADVEYKQSNQYSIKISAQQNILDQVQTDVENGKLIISFPRNTNIRHQKDIKIEISAPAVTALGISGSGNIKVEGPYNPKNGRLSVSGSGDISVETINTGDLDVVISGSGNIKIKEGNANKADLHISGSGSIDLANVAVKSASAKSSGSGDMKVNVSEELDARISGSGNVLYKGRPVVDTRVSGSGSVKHL